MKLSELQAHSEQENYLGQQLAENFKHQWTSVKDIDTLNVLFEQNREML